MRVVVLHVIATRCCLSTAQKKRLRNARPINPITSGSKWRRRVVGVWVRFPCALAHVSPCLKMQKRVSQEDRIMNNAFSDHPPYRCMRCHNSGSTKDALGMYWCEKHEHHSKVINWGASHNWPNLQSYP